MLQHNTNFILHIIFFEIRNIYETMWRNIVQCDGPQMTR